MNSSRLLALIDKGELLYVELERETTGCLAKVGTLQGEGIERFMAKRQEIIASIQKFDTEFTLHLTRAGFNAEQTTCLKEFRERLCMSLHRTIGADRLLLALAEMEKGRIQADLADIAKGRQALREYGTSALRSPFSLNRTV